MSRCSRHSPAESARRSSSWRAAWRRAASLARGLEFCWAASCALAASVAIAPISSWLAGSASSSHANASSQTGSSPSSSDGADSVRSGSAAPPSSACKTSVTPPIRVQHGTAASACAAAPACMATALAPAGRVSTAWPRSWPPRIAGPAASTRTGPPGRSRTQASASGAPRPYAEASACTRSARPASLGAPYSSAGRGISVSCQAGSPARTCHGCGLLIPASDGCCRARLTASRLTRIVTI